MFMGNIHTICWPMSNILIKLLRNQIEDQKLKMPVYFRIGAFKTIHWLLLSWSRKAGRTKKEKKNSIECWVDLLFLTDDIPVNTTMPLQKWNSGERPIHLKYVSKQEKAIYQHRTARKECMLHLKAITEPRLTPISLQTYWQSLPTYFHLL